MSNEDSKTTSTLTKAAVRSFARTLTNELKDRKIRVNVVSPGPIDTQGITNLAAGPETEKQFKAQMIAGVPSVA